MIGLPRGYVQRPSGEGVLDPHEQVRSTLRLMFEGFESRRSIRRLLTYLADHDIHLHDRVLSGSCKGEGQWNRPDDAMLGGKLRRPAYAGLVGLEFAAVTIVEAAGYQLSSCGHDTPR
ncbi:hypothetical protein [Methylobacterium tarhaniae]|uniref:hypothetical protein n=1 Tax=Methylobacterium tarhaniae TaxID=1187852 RepID=UPI003D0181AB